MKAKRPRGTEFVSSSFSLLNKTSCLSIASLSTKVLWFFLRLSEEFSSLFCLIKPINYNCQVFVFLLTNVVFAGFSKQTHF
jgi:hypothetical protein